MNIKFPEPQFENIEIKCKTGNKENKDHTAFLINEISMVYDYASRFMQGQGYEELAHNFDEKSKILFNILKKSGCYDKYI